MRASCRLVPCLSRRAAPSAASGERGGCDECRARLVLVRRDVQHHGIWDREHANDDDGWEEGEETSQQEA